MNLPARLLRFFFHHLYHGLAFTYDLVAWTVSFGQWKNWIRAVLPYIEGARILELGHGPGHLQVELSSRSAKSPDFADANLQRRETLESIAIGLDESAQMGRLSHVRLARSGHARSGLARGLAQSLPFAEASFDCIVSTFPAEYIFEAQTASEAWRTLKSGGRLIVLPVAWPKNRFLSWLFRVTKQAPSEAVEVVKAKISQPFAHAGFDVRVETLKRKASVLLLVIAQKSLEKQ